MDNKNYQILAPAGNMQSLRCAVNNGADAVYLGLDSFNARMKADNFTADNIKEAVDFCHLFGVKVYVAVNTSIKNAEFCSAVNSVLVAYNNNADGVIVTDLALMKYASTLPKPFEIVASTQLNIHDKFGAQLAKEMGATTVVCARECTYDDIAEIASTGVNVECFIHGALCVCQSGQCLMSAMVGGNSGNRGLCAQPCRKKYFCDYNGRHVEGYLLSTKDLCGVNFAEKLHKLGATTYKIEGRNRRAEYAGSTSRLYSNLFSNDFEVDTTDVELAKEMYNRGDYVGDNYLLGNNGCVVYPYAQGHIGVSVGVVKSKCLVTKYSIAKGDGFKIFHNQVEVGNAIAKANGSGVVPLEISGRITDNDEVRRTTSVELCNEVLSAKRTNYVRAYFEANAGSVPELTLEGDGVIVKVSGEEPCQLANKTATTCEEIRQQLLKTGNSYTTIIDIDIDIDDIFLPKSQINALRRGAIEAFEQEVIAKYNEQFVERKVVEYVCPNVTKREDNCIAVTCYSVDQVQEALKVAKYVIYKPTYLDKKAFEIDGVFVDIPSFANLDYIGKVYSSRCLGLVCHNVGAVQFCRANGIKYIAGSGLNIYNDSIVECFADAETFVYSLELTANEIASFSHRNGLVFVDGNIVLMKLVHCPYKVSGGSSCEKCTCTKPLVYTDELNNNFVITRRRDSKCTFELSNGKKLSVANKLKTAGRYLIDYDNGVISHYVNLNNGVEDNFVETKPYTKGRLYNTTT